MQHNLGENEPVVGGWDGWNCLLDASFRLLHFSSPDVVVNLSLFATFLLHRANKTISVGFVGNSAPKRLL
jgi:hypothetical protein